MNWMRRDQDLKEAELSRFKNAISDFFRRSKPEDTSLILDGPGIGLAQLSVILKLIGSRRLSQIKAIHVFSGSSFAVLWHYAQADGHLLLDRESALKYYSRNQGARGIRPGVSMIQGMLKKVMGRKYIHSNDFLEDCLPGTISSIFLDRPVSEWPDNLHFWSYDSLGKRFVDLNSKGEAPSMPTSKLIRGTAAIPGLFEPFWWGPYSLIDAILAPGIKGHLKALRQESTDCLVVSMHREGRFGNCTYLKPHSDSNGYRRLIWDYFVWVSGLRNREYGKVLVKGLFEVQPVEMEE